MPRLLTDNYWQGEWGMLNKDKLEYPVFAQLTLHYDSKQKPIYLSTLLIDLTDQVQAKKEAKNRQQQINRLMNASVISEAASSLAHQLNQPLASISSTLQRWQSNLNHQKKRHTECTSCDITTEIDSLVEKTFYMGKLIHHVNSAVKRSEFEADWIMLTDIITEAKDNLISNTMGVSYIINIDSILKQHAIHADEILLTQIFYNLLSNSQDEILESQIKNPIIQIDAKLIDEMLTIEIIDNGKGIAPSRIDSIFEPFYSTKELGSGIGLSWVKSTLEIMNGSIRLASTPDKNNLSGAYFILEIPTCIKPR